MINSLLLEHIKKLLLSAPLDIYSECEETVSQSSYELVEPRPLNIETDYFSEFSGDSEDTAEDDSRVIGSANLFIAASIVCNEVTQGKNLSNLSEKDLSVFQEYWKIVLNCLVSERFMRETQEVAHSKIKLVINNKELPDIGVQI